MSSIEARLRRIELELWERKKAQPPDPLHALFTERLYVAAALAEMDTMEGGESDFFQHLAALRVMLPDSLRDVVLQRALSHTPQSVSRLQVSPEMRATTTIQLVDCRFL